GSVESFGGLQSNDGYSSGGSGYRSTPCGPGKLTNALGVCDDVIASRNVFVYQGPHASVNVAPPPYIPKPQVEYNVVLVRTPNKPYGPDPVVVPPPQQKTLVYVLTENDEVQQQVIEVPQSPALEPEVFYVNHNGVENPILGGGVNLQDALSSFANEQGGFGSRYGGGFGNAFNNFGDGVNVLADGFNNFGNPLSSLNNGFNTLGNPLSLNNGFNTLGNPLSLNNGFNDFGNPLSSLNNGFNTFGNEFNILGNGYDTIGNIGNGFENQYIPGNYY
ncbi:UNVERIFIED_CONTAM: hypothetical protein GTU68_031993, partial [Idotea baltica]|nr:hypothetical protein [Idotea baltica]